MTFRAIFYDLDGTLRMNDPISWRAFADFVSTVGIAIAGVDVLRLARWEHSYFADSPLLRKDSLTFTSTASFWTNYGYRQLLELGVTPARAIELSPVVYQYMTDSYRPKDFIPEGLVETLGILKNQGYLLGVLSNRSESFSDYLAEQGLADFFSLAIYAKEAGAFKPDPAVFYYLLEKAGVSAENSIYVGDNYFADVVGARQAGLSPVLLDVNGLFDDPGCPVIQNHRQILALL